MLLTKMLGFGGRHRLRSTLSRPRRLHAGFATAFSSSRPLRNAATASTIELRPGFDHSQTPIEVTESPDPTWSYGQGIRVGLSPDHAHQTHREIDPDAPDRRKSDNYHLLISGITPRPIGLVSTQSSDGKTKNLAPFSYFQVVEHDPPLFILGIGMRAGKLKDTYLHLKDSGECVINTVSEHMIEAVNATSLDSPFGLSEWDVSGLEEAPSVTVKPSRVKESVFSIEGKVVDIKEFKQSDLPGTRSTAVVLIRGTRFWIRDDATNEEANHIDLDKLRPLGQLGGMAYGRITSVFDLPRGKWAQEKLDNELLQDLEKKDSD